MMLRLQLLLLLGCAGWAASQFFQFQQQGGINLEDLMGGGFGGFGGGGGGGGGYEELPQEEEEEEVRHHSLCATCPLPLACDL